MTLASDNSGVSNLKKLVSGYKRIVVVSTIQFKKHIDKIVHELNAVNGGVILGCTKNFCKGDCYVLIGTGKFHAIRIATITNITTTYLFLSTFKTPLHPEF